MIVTLDINKILTPQRSIETQSKFIFGHKLNHFELARVVKCWWCTEIVLGGGPLCMHNVIGEVIVPSDAGLILRHCPSLPVRPLWSEGWRSTEGVILKAVLIAKNTFTTGRQERGFICNVTRISVELIPTVPYVNWKVVLTQCRVWMN